MQTEAETTTEKFGLEAGLWKVWSSKNAEGLTKGEQVRTHRGLINGEQIRETTAGRWKV